MLVKKTDECRERKHFDGKLCLLIASTLSPNACHILHFQENLSIRNNIPFVLQDDELARKALESFEEALSTINSDGWKVEKQTPEGDVVHSKFVRRNHKIFRITVSERAGSDIKCL